MTFSGVISQVLLRNRKRPFCLKGNQYILPQVSKVIDLTASYCCPGAKENLNKSLSLRKQQTLLWYCNSDLFSRDILLGSSILMISAFAQSFNIFHFVPRALCFNKRHNDCSPSLSVVYLLPHFDHKCSIIDYVSNSAANYNPMQLGYKVITNLPHHESSSIVIKNKILNISSQLLSFVLNHSRKLFKVVLNSRCRH